MECDFGANYRETYRELSWTFLEWTYGTGKLMFTHFFDFSLFYDHFSTFNKTRKFYDVMPQDDVMSALGYFKLRTSGKKLFTLILPQEAKFKV